ncbi:MAG: ATP-binding protein [Trebonia sp.]|jgi:anti-sigma regulatory factor (Ser/Thr protein kinase)
MDTPLKSRSTARATPHKPGCDQRTAILGSATVPGRPEEVSGARAFVARTLSAVGKTPAVDADTATLLTSELVTNAILHTASGAAGGTVTIVVVDVEDGVLIEVVDDGSAGTPVVKDDLLTTDGHGLFLVQQLTAQWGYLRDAAGTTVWFHLPSDWSPDGS